MIKKSLFTTIIGMLLLGCDPMDNSSAENIALINQYVQSVESKDYESMSALLADNYLGLGPSVGDSIDKELALIAWKDNAENLYEKIDYQRSRTFAVDVPDGENKGNWVANWAALEITYKGSMETVQVWANTIYQIEDQKIIKSYTFYNEADILRQLGYVFVKAEE